MAGINRKEVAAEAKRRSLADDGKSSKKERFALRNEIRAEQGFSPEAKTRGGLARIYDNEKRWLAPVAAGLAGLTGIGGAFAPAILGGLQGFDRPGEGGIGYDVGSGLKGAAIGAAAGGLGKMAGNALNIGVGAVPAGASAASGATAASTAGAAGLPPVPASSGGFLGKLGGLAGKAGDWLMADGGRNALGAITAIDAASQRRRADDLASKAVGLDTNRWQDSAPLRTAGMTGLLNPVPADLSRLQALGSQGNPFALPNPSPAPTPMGAPSPAPMAPVPAQAPMSAPRPVAPMPQVGGSAPRGAMPKGRMR